VKARVTLSITTKVLAEFDRLRGDVSRSVAVERLIEAAIVDHPLSTLFK
jgi:metal-responsive CopG/Arc/MetJ family transcriptional regulator